MLVLNKIGSQTLQRNTPFSFGIWKCTSVKEKEGLWNCLRPFACPFVWPIFCGCLNSAIIGQIHSKSSSLEPCWPVDVQRHGHLPIGAHMGVPMGVMRALRISRTPELSCVDSLQIQFIKTGLACQHAKSRTFAKGGHMDMLMAIIRLLKRVRQ